MREQEGEIPNNVAKSKEILHAYMIITEAETGKLPLLDPKI